MKFKFKKTILSVIVIGFLFSCTDDDDDSIAKSGINNITPTETELITTVRLLIRDTLSNSMDTVEFKDVDGQGGNAPLVDSIKLLNNRFYEVQLKFLDESDANDIEDITLEIQAEAAEHIVCYEPASTSAISINRTDSDGTYPIGLSSDWMSMMSYNGTLKITLKHQPSIKNGSCDLGETDIEVDYPLVIQ